MRFEATGLEQAPGDVVGQVPESECRSAQMLEASVNRLGRPVGSRPARRQRASSAVLSSTGTPALSEPGLEHLLGSVLDHVDQPELVEPAELGQVRTGEGSARQVEVFWMGGVGTPIFGGPRRLPSHRPAGDRQHLQL